MTLLRMAALAATSVLGGLAVAALAAWPARAADRPQVEPGARVHVVAARNSRVFTVCPATTEMTPPNQTVAGAERRVIVRIVRDTMHMRDLRDPEAPRWASWLPLPPGADAAAGALVDRVELDRGRLAPDDEVKAAIESEFARRKSYRLAASVEGADVVFLAEGLYGAYARFEGASRGVVVGGQATSNVVGGDWEANFRDAVIGIAVPSAAYRQRPGDMRAVLEARVWDGIALAGNRTKVVQPRTRTSPGRRETSVEQASVEALVDQFHDGARMPAVYPPLCAATDGSFDPESRGSAASRGEVAVEGATDARAAAPRSPAPSDLPTFRAGVTYVPVPTVVTDAEGNIVTGLSAPDFRLYEDDRAQTIDRLSVTSAPFSIAVLVDTSASMRLEMESVQQAVLGFVERLRPDDRLAVVSFDSRIFGHSDPTSDRGRLRRAVFQMARGVATRLYDAVEVAAKSVVRETPDRKAMVLVTDGVDSQSRLATASGSLEAAGESGVLVYVVQYDTRAHHVLEGPPNGKPVLLPEGALDTAPLYERADRYLADLVERGGGTRHRAATPADLNQALAQVARDLSEQYTLCYYPENQSEDGAYRRIRVEVSRPGLTVRARAGYRARHR